MLHKLGAKRCWWNNKLVLYNSVTGVFDLFIQSNNKGFILRLYVGTEKHWKNLIQMLPSFFLFFFTWGHFSSSGFKKPKWNPPVIQSMHSLVIFWPSPSFFVFSIRICLFVPEGRELWGDFEPSLRLKFMHPNSGSQNHVQTAGCQRSRPAAGGRSCVLAPRCYVCQGILERDSNTSLFHSCTATTWQHSNV